VWRGMNVSFRDMLFLLVFMYLLIGGIALAHVHKKAEESKGAQPPGNVIVELRWAPEIDADVDPIRAVQSSISSATTSAIAVIRTR